MINQSFEAMASNLRVYVDDADALLASKLGNIEKQIQQLETQPTPQTTTVLVDNIPVTVNDLAVSKTAASEQAIDLLLSHHFPLDGDDHTAIDLIYGNNYDLHRDDGLTSAITLSIYSDARVGNKNGWWGDSYLDPDDKVANSKLWTLLGKTTTQEHINLGIDYIKQALQWMLDDQLLLDIKVSANHLKRKLDIFAFKIIATKPDGNVLSLRL